MKVKQPKSAADVTKYVVRRITTEVFGGPGTFGVFPKEAKVISEATALAVGPLCAMESARDNLNGVTAVKKSRYSKQMVRVQIGLQNEEDMVL
jgi:hypothetical protein